MAENTDKKSDAFLVAEMDSKDCRICGGEGMATVYAPGYDGSALRRDNLGRPFVARTMAHCSCPLGRHIRASWKEDLIRRTPDVVDIMDIRQRWSLIDPTKDFVDDPGRPVTKDDFDAFWVMAANLRVTLDAERVAEPKQTGWSIQTNLRKRLAREIGLDERVADVLTIEELQKVKEART
jgi:hypothetical protein